MSNSRSIHLSTSFVHSSGTVTLDLHQRKVLVIRCRNSDEVLFPKGRKTEGETLEAAAIRETYEETDYQAALLPLAVASLATRGEPIGLGSSSDTTDTLRAHTEPVAVTQRASSGAHKIIFWFAATADSLAVPDADTQQEDEDFEVLWVSFQESQDKLTFDDDKAVAAYVIDAITSALRDNTLLSIYPRPLPLSFMSIDRGFFPAHLQAILISTKLPPVVLAVPLSVIKQTRETFWWYRCLHIGNMRQSRQTDRRPDEVG